MTVAINTLAVLPYIGNGTAYIFPITFPTFEVENVEVDVADSIGTTTTLVLATDFTLANIGKPGVQGSVTLVNNGKAYLNGTGKLNTGYTLYVKFAPNSVSQPMKGRDWGQFAPERFERTLDRLAMSVLAVKALAGKALGLQLGESGSGVLPPLAGNAKRIVQINSSATGFEYGVDSDTIAAYRDAAQAARDTAQTYRNSAQTYANNAAAEASDANVDSGIANTAATNAQAAKVAAETARDGAAASASQASSSAAQANTSKNDAATSATAAAASATAAATAQGFRDQAQTYRDAALAAKTAAETAQTGSVAAKTASESARDLSIAAKTASESARDLAIAADTDAQTRAASALVSANNSELFANLGLFNRIVSLTVANSPYTVNKDTEQDVMFVVDDSGGNVVINLPLIANTADHIGWKVGVMKAAATANTLTVVPNTTDTINLQASQVVSTPKLGMVVYAKSPVNWAGRLFTDAALATDPLPPGGNVGDILVKAGTIDGQAGWTPDQSIINALIFG